MKDHDNVAAACGDKTMSLATLVVMPNIIAAVTGVNAISLAARTVRVELNTPHLHTVRFARSKFQGEMSAMSAMNLADACRVVAYRFGKPCVRNLTR